MATAGCESINESLSSLTPVSPRQAAEYALDPDDPDNRREGILLLSNSHFGYEPTYVTLYREYVRYESDSMVRAVSIQALSRYGDPADAMFILPHLTDENIQVRREASKGLQRLHNPAVISDLIIVLRDPNENAEVRSAAAIALGQYPEDEVFQGLVTALDARELSINLATQHSLRTLTGQDFGLDSAAWYDWHLEAEREGTVFTGQQEYFYPTYSRKLSWMEQLAFWSKPTFESPGQPAGMTPGGRRSTYEDEGERPEDKKPVDSTSAPGK